MYFGFSFSLFLINCIFDLESLTGFAFKPEQAERTCLLNIQKGYRLNKDTVKVTGTKGESFTVPVIKDVVFEGETKILMGDVLLVPGAGSNFLKRDLQVKLEIGVLPEEGKMTARVLKLGQEDEKKN